MKSKALLYRCANQAAVCGRELLYSALYATALLACLSSVSAAASDQKQSKPQPVPQAHASAKSSGQGGAGAPAEDRQKHPAGVKYEPMAMKDAAAGQSAGQTDAARNKVDAFNIKQKTQSDATNKTQGAPIKGCGKCGAYAATQRKSGSLVSADFSRKADAEKSKSKPATGTAPKN